MMFTCQNVNTNKLLSELKSAGVDISAISSDMRYGDTIAKNAWFEIDDSDLALVQSVIDGHDVTPIPPQKTESEILKERLEATEQMLLQIMMEGMM